jgi:hypothetical protein
MHLEAAKSLTDALLRQWPNLNGWELQINPRFTRILGQCDYRRRLIVLGKSFVLLNDEPLIVQSAKHEIAHALVGPGHGHDEIWKRQAVALGIPPDACDKTARLPLGKLIAACPCCATVYSIYRKPKNLNATIRWCIPCGPIKGALTFVPNPAWVES